MLKHSGREILCIHMSSDRKAQYRYTWSFLFQHLVVLPLLIKNLMQMLSLFGIIGIILDWQIFQLSALVQIQEIGHIQEKSYIWEIGYFQNNSYIRGIGYFQEINYFQNFENSLFIKISLFLEYSLFFKKLQPLLHRNSTCWHRSWK